MNNISRVNGTLTAVPALKQLDNIKGFQQDQIDLSYNDSGEDQVEISDKAKYLSQLSDMPDIRQEKVDQIRQQLVNGTYDIDGKLPMALDKLFAEETGF